MFILETLKQLHGADLAAGRLPRSASVGALIDRRLRALSPDALALARLAAIAGADFSLALAEEVTGRGALHLADPWAELEAAQVLRNSAFAHDLVLEATLRGIPQPIAEHLHGAVARHLQAHGGEAARLAAHWLAARDETAALPNLLRAADAARDAMRRREELEFVERAAEIAARHPVKDLPSSHALHVRAFLAREIIDGVAPALPALDRALEHASTEAERANVLSLRACARTKLYELDSAVEDGQAALVLALRAGDDKVVADIMSTLATALSILDRHDEAAALMARHWSVVERMPDPESSFFTERGLVCDNAGRPHDGREFHRRAIDNCHAARRTFRGDGRDAEPGCQLRGHWRVGDCGRAAATGRSAAPGARPHAQRAGHGRQPAGHRAPRPGPLQPGPGRQRAGTGGRRRPAAGARAARSATSRLDLVLAGPVDPRAAGPAEGGQLPRTAGLGDGARPATACARQRDTRRAARRRAGARNVTT
jgi:hypothetical protein